MSKIMTPVEVWKCIEKDLLSSLLGWMTSF